MGQSILQIILKVTKEGTGARDAAREAKDLKATLSDLGLGSLASVTALGALSTATGALTAFTVDAVNETVKLADEVRNMSMLTGQSAEDASRLLQVMDDLKVKTSTLTMATKTLAKEGLTMNIETLAKLSDQYNALGNNADKTAFLVKNFGKSGLQMAEAMKQGGSALRAMNTQVEAALVLTSESVESARQYQRELDNLNDSFLAVKVSVGTQVLPVMNNLMDQTSTFIGMLQSEADAWRYLIPIIGPFNALIDYATIRVREQNAAANSATTSYTAMAEAMERAAPSTETLAEKQKLLEEAEKAAADAARKLSDGFKLQLSLMDSMQSSEDDYANNAKSNAEERIKIEADKAAYIAMYGTWNVAKIKEFDDALAENSKAAQQNANDHELASRKIILGLIEQTLAADGLTQDEMNFLLEKGQAWGIYSDKVVAEAKRAIDEANAINNAINGITTSKDIHITTYYDIIGSTKSLDYFGPQHATGTNGWETVPSGFPMDSYPVHLSSGEKYSVIPAGGSAPGGSGGGSVVVNASFPTLSLADSDGLMSALYPVIVSALRRAKSDGVIK